MELQRNFNLLRELDLQTQLLVTSIEERMQAILQPEAGASSSGGHFSGATLERLRQDCRKALEQTDEKVSVATHAHEMVRWPVASADALPCPQAHPTHPAS